MELTVDLRLRYAFGEGVLFGEDRNQDDATTSSSR
jgi:hypothetical protein